MLTDKEMTLAWLQRGNPDEGEATESTGGPLCFTSLCHGYPGRSHYIPAGEPIWWSMDDEEGLNQNACFCEACGRRLAEFNGTGV